MFKRIRLALFALVLATPLAAQELTLEDLRTDLVALGQQIEDLRSQLSSTGSSGLTAQESASVLVRIDEYNAELRRAVGRVETLELKIQAVIDDGSRRIGDLEFRMTELEGGDTSLETNPVPLGGADDANVAETVSGERRDFNAAKQALEDGDGATAARLLADFALAYPDGPMSVEARYLQGEALVMQNDHQNAARSFLKSFSSAPDSPFAPLSLFQLSKSLHILGQTEQACLTLLEIPLRYRNLDAAMARDVLEEQGAQGCS